MPPISISEVSVTKMLPDALSRFRIWSSPQNVLPEELFEEAALAVESRWFYSLPSFSPSPSPTFPLLLGEVLSCSFFVFIPDHEACGILLPRPGIKPVLPVVEAPVVTTGPPGKSLSLLKWLDQSPSLHLSGGLGAESKSSLEHSVMRRRAKKMKDWRMYCKYVYHTCPAVAGWWFWPLHLYQLSWQFHWCGRIGVRALVGNQGGGSSWSTGRHPARHWYLCISHVCPHGP